MTTPEPPFVTVDGFATIVGLARGTVVELRGKGKLPPPDVILGQTHGWRPATARKWAAERELERPAPVFLDATGAAKHLGIKRSTWTAYANENRTPPPDFVLGNVNAWTPATLDAWQRTRPGRGARTDLTPPTRKAKR